MARPTKSLSLPQLAPPMVSSAASPLRRRSNGTVTGTIERPLLLS